MKYSQKQLAETIIEQNQQQQQQQNQVNIFMKLNNSTSVGQVLHAGNGHDAGHRYYIIYCYIVIIVPQIKLTILGPK